VLLDLKIILYPTGNKEYLEEKSIFRYIR